MTKNGRWKQVIETAMKFRAGSGKQGDDRGYTVGKYTALSKVVTGQHFPMNPKKVARLERLVKEI